MADPPIRVDILSLEDFRRSLDTRLTAAKDLVTTLETGVTARPPLGGFLDAGDTATSHATRHTALLDRMRRVVTAIEAAQSATDVIINSYRTTEARNAANAEDISAALAGVRIALFGEANV
jgi:hypothetical protein